MSNQPNSRAGSAEASQRPALQVRGLRKVFKVRAENSRHTEDLVAVDDVSFNLLQSGSLGIVGESGSGKTTVATAALLQITEHAERLAALDERETTHHLQVAGRLTELARQLAEATKSVAGIQATAARQAAIVDSLDGLDQQVATIAARLTDLAPERGNADRGKGDSYRPVPVPRWWKLTGNEREQGPARLRAWVEQIYRPGYGHLAAALGPCWDQHSLCLYGLDWLMELWSLLYLAPDRTAGTIASQAEWQTRLLPALAEQMYLETTRCDHARQAARRQSSPTHTFSQPGRPTVNTDADRQDRPRR